jgi:DNA (cytosine-5)-methyltransferase 1
MTYRVLDLFSGIGGFSLGLERTGGFTTVAFCEIEPFPRKVLAKHWSGVPIYDDVRTLTADRLASDGIAVDVICGGFPCQDISLAGKGAGLAGERSGLWSEYARLIGELRPRYVIVENVANLLAGPNSQPGQWFGRVLGDLAERRYDAEWENIPASALGATHRRARAWIVAYPEKSARGVLQGCASLRLSGKLGGGAGREWVRWVHQPTIRGDDDGVPDISHRLGALGNAVYPDIAELIGRAILASASTEAA